jgi:hypothetical protein
VDRLSAERWARDTLDSFPGEYTALVQRDAASPWREVWA